MALPRALINFLIIQSAMFYFLSLFQDGTLFAISPCMQLAGKKEGYSEMK
jgi:hypothetical protein